MTLISAAAAALFAAPLLSQGLGATAESGPAKGLLGAAKADPASGQAFDDPIQGERLEPSAIGPGRIEDLEQVRARVRAAEASEATPIPARHGEWIVPKRRSTSVAHSGLHHLVNEWGDPRMELAFDEAADLLGFFVGGQGESGIWPRAIRAIGYRAGHEVGRSEWFGPLERVPRWFATDLIGVDRVEIEAIPTADGAAWWTLDDLEWRPRSGRGLPRIVDFEDLDYRERLNGTKYAGIEWRAGSGFQREVEWDLDAVPAPRSVASDPSSGTSLPPAGFLGGGGTAPVNVFDFRGLRRSEASNSIPPDTHGAIGPDHFCILVNRGFGVFNRINGALLFSSSLSMFLPGATGDPRILFDQHSGRWIAMATNFTGRIQFAVSMTDDPLGAWFKTDFQAAMGADAGCFVDYPTLGVDVNGIYIGAFMATTCSLTLFAIDKAPLLSTPPSVGTITAFRGVSPAGEGALQPAHSHGISSGEYFLSATGTQIRVRRIDPPLTSPTFVSLGVLNVGPHPSPFNAPALGSNTNLSLVDWRLMNAVVRDETIWTTHHVRVDGRAAVRWYEIDGPTATLVQSGTVEDPELHYFFPSIAVNATHDVVLGFSGSNASQFVACYYTGRLQSDPAGEMAPPELLRAGAGPYNVLDPGGRNRWGDYSHTSLDPLDESSLWTIQEYTFGTDEWGTWVAELEFGGTVVCEDPVPFCVGAMNSTGVGAGIGHQGTTSATIQDLSITATGCPTNQNGVFYYGHDPIQLPFGDGFRCVGGGTFRFPPVTTDFFGDVSMAVDFSAAPAGSGPGELVVGSTWYFQFWYRDPAGAGSGFNLSDGLELMVCP